MNHVHMIILQSLKWV